MFKSTSIVKLLVATVAMTTLAGCGSNPASVDDGTWSDDSSYTDPYAGGTTTGTGTTGYGSTTGGYGTTTGAGCTAPTVGYGSAMGGDLTATVTTKKNGSFLGMGKFTCTVEVSNPSSTPKTGTLTVTFKNGSKTSKTAPVSQSVSLGANETRTFDFVDKAWSTDAVEADIVTDAATTGATGAAGCATSGTYGAYGATGTTGAYGTTTGASTGYTY